MPVQVTFSGKARREEPAVDAGNTGEEVWSSVEVRTTDLGPQRADVIP